MPPSRTLPPKKQHPPQLCLFWAKNHMDRLLWDKHEGDGKQLSPGQSMASGFSAALLGPVATGAFGLGWVEGCG
jgi:hypothetical protein